MEAKLRIKCPHCNEAGNVRTLQDPCPECGKPMNVSGEGCIYIYRQGSPIGIAGRFGLYINEVPYGYIGNKELLCLPLPYGTYVIHSAVGMSRKCQDLQVTISPEHPTAYTKVYMRSGFWANSFVVEPLDPKLLDM